MCKLRVLRPTFNGQRNPIKGNFPATIGPLLNMPMPEVDPGVSLSAEDQKHLPVLAAYRNRLFRAPPPVKIEVTSILPAFKHLEKLVEGLLAAG